MSRPSIRAVTPSHVVDNRKKVCCYGNKAGWPYFPDIELREKVHLDIFWKLNSNLYTCQIDHLLTSMLQTSILTNGWWSVNHVQGWVDLEIYWKVIPQLWWPTCVVRLTKTIAWVLSQQIQMLTNRWWSVKHIEGKEGKVWLEIYGKVNPDLCILIDHDQCMGTYHLANEFIYEHVLTIDQGMMVSQAYWRRAADVLTSARVEHNNCANNCTEHRVALNEKYSRATIQHYVQHNNCARNSTEHWALLIMSVLASNSLSSCATQ